jgi:hypothetical protein
VYFLFICGKDSVFDHISQFTDNKRCQ